MLQPIKDNVLVLPDAPEKRIGLIHIPECAQEQMAVGKVIAAGPKVKGIFPLDRVAFPVSLALVRKATIDDAEFIVLPEYQVLGLLRPGTSEGKTEFVPLKDRVLVVRDKQMTRLPSGVEIPVEAIRRPLRSGTIIKVGEGQNELKVGQHIFFHTAFQLPGREKRKDKMQMYAFPVDGKEWIVVPAEDVAGVYDE